MTDEKFTEHEKYLNQVYDDSIELAYKDVADRYRADHQAVRS